MYGYQSWTRTSDNGRKPPGCCAVRHTCYLLHAALSANLPHCPVGFHESCTGFHVLCTLGAHLASLCHAHLAYFNALHFSKPCRTKGCGQESAVCKAIQGLEMQVHVAHNCFIATITPTHIWMTVNQIAIS